MSSAAKTEWECDRCSFVELKLTDWGRPFSWSKSGDRDLCEKCTRSLQRWWDEGRVCCEAAEDP